MEIHCRTSGLPFAEALISRNPEISRIVERQPGSSEKRNSVVSDLRCFGHEDGIPLLRASGLALDNSGNFWISGDQGLCKWKPGGSAVYFHRDLAERGYLMGVDALSVLNETHVWIGVQQPNGNLQLQELDN